MLLLFKRDHEVVAPWLMRCSNLELCPTLSGLWKSDNRMVQTLKRSVGGQWVAGCLSTVHHGVARLNLLYAL